MNNPSHVEITSESGGVCAIGSQTLSIKLESVKRKDTRAKHKEAIVKSLKRMKHGMMPYIVHVLPNGMVDAS